MIRFCNSAFHRISTFVLLGTTLLGNRLFAEDAIRSEAGPEKTHLSADLIVVATALKDGKSKDVVADHVKVPPHLAEWLVVSQQTFKVDRVLHGDCKRVITLEYLDHDPKREVKLMNRPVIEYLTERQYLRSRAGWVSITDISYLMHLRKVGENVYVYAFGDDDPRRSVSAVFYAP